MIERTEQDIAQTKAFLYRSAPITPAPWHTTVLPPMGRFVYILNGVGTEMARIDTNHLAVDTALANARLIAKAPELRALLIDLVEHDATGDRLTKARTLLQEIAKGEIAITAERTEP